MEIDCNKTWKIINIKNLDGSEATRPTTVARIGRTGYFDTDIAPQEGIPMCFFYLRDNNGELISGKMLRTTKITNLEYFEFDCRTEIPDYIIVTTQNSIYTLEEVIDAQVRQTPVSV